MGTGWITRIIGPVIDVRFPEGERLPDIYNALEVRLPDRKIVMEVLSQLGGGRVRCISLFPTDGLARGTQVINTGTPLNMPVGNHTLGRMLNVVGEPIDGLGPVKAEEYWPIHHKSPSFTSIVPSMILETASSAGFDDPFCKGSNWLFGALCGQTVLIMSFPQYRYEHQLFVFAV